MSTVDARTITTGLAGSERTSAATEPEELPRGTRVERYVIIDPIGRGGMGTVYAAWDPDLGRRVALKLLHREVAAGRDDPILGEARALARLRHPHVVTVHDVGTWNSQAFVALEFLDHPTLRKWLRSTPSRAERIAVIEQCAEGLAAAHRAGLAHGDFKPDNVLIETTARGPVARVIDFGLARRRSGQTQPEADADTSEEPIPGVAGTPGYMPLEVLLGASADPRSDQWSFALTAVETLTDRRPSRSELDQDPAAGTGIFQQVLARALAEDPAARWPSMEALLQGLQHRRTRRRRGRIALGLGALATLATAAYARQHLVRAGQVKACEKAGAQIETLWNDRTRQEVQQGLLDTGSSYAAATSERVLPWLDEHAAAWSEQRTRACLSGSAEPTLTARQLERARWCLDDRRRDLESVTEQLRAADSVILQNAVALTSNLPAPEACLHGSVLASLPDPPDDATRSSVAELRLQLARAETMMHATKYERGLELADAALGRAEAIGWPPLTAEARTLRGALHLLLGHHQRAEEDLTAAWLQGAKAGNWRASAAAANDLVALFAGSANRRGEARAWAIQAELAASLTGDPLRMLEANRATNLALVEEAEGRPAEALALHQHVLDIYSEQLGPDHPRAAAAENHVASRLLDLGRHDQARARLESSLQRLQTALGEAHPFVAVSRINLARLHQDMGELERARDLLEEALVDLRASVGSEHPWVGMALLNLGTVHAHAERHDDARARYQEALRVLEAVHGPDHPLVATCLDNLAAMHAATGDAERSLSLHDRALQIRQRTLGSDHPDLAISLTNVGLAHAELGQLDHGKRMLQQALEVAMAAEGAEHPHVAETMTALAQIELDLGNAERARDLCQGATDIFEAHEGKQPGELETQTTLQRALAAL